MPPDPVAVLSERLRAAYTAAWERVKAEERAIIDDPRRFARAARLRELQERIIADMDQLDQQARRWLAQTFPQAYTAGGEAMASELGKSFRFSQTHRQAVSSLAADTFNDLLTATEGVRDSTKLLVRRLVREETLSKVIEGKTARESAAIVRKQLEAHGIHALIYADGTRHGVAEYSNMVLRTKTAVAYNVGQLNTARENAVTFMEVFDGFGCGWIGHDDADIANGTVRSIAECAQAAISHPNCQRAFGPRPDIKTKTAARKATDVARHEAGVTEQISERAAIARREEAVARQASRRRANDRVGRRVQRAPQIRSAKQVATDLLRLGRDPGNVITRDLSELVRANRGELSGLRNRFKRVESLERKIKTDVLESAVKGLRITPAEAGAALKDVLRFTAIGDGDTLLAMQDDVLRHLESKGHKVLNLKNTWQRGNAYRGINVQMEGPTGQLYELQFHTPQSFTMKEKINHALYEEMRLSSTSEKRKAELAKIMSKNSARLVEPKGALRRAGEPWKSRVHL